MSRLILLSIILFGLVFPSITSATPTTNLFTGEVVVKDRSVRSWREGVKSALTQVLIKVTGNPNIASVTDVQQMYSDVRRLVSSYRYRRKAIYGKMNQTFLTVEFDPTEIKQTLKDAGQVVWNSNRPTTLIWLALQTSAGAQYTQILSNDQNQQYAAILKGAASRRGIPVMLPKMDLTEISSVSAKDVLNFNVPLLTEIGNRYAADGLLIAKVTFEDDQYWHVRCVWVANGSQFEWTQQETDLDALMSDIIDRLSTQIANTYIALQSADETRTVMVKVTGVSGLDEYSKVIDYLRTLAPIKDVQLDSMESSAVILSVTYGGEEENLNRAIVNAKDHRLTQIEFDNTDDSQDEYAHNKSIELMYSWHPMES